MPQLPTRVLVTLHDPFGWETSTYAGKIGWPYAARVVDIPTGGLSRSNIVFASPDVSKRDLYALVVDAVVNLFANLNTPPIILDPTEIRIITEVN